MCRNIRLRSTHTYPPTLCDVLKSPTLPSIPPLTSQNPNLPLDPIFSSTPSMPPNPHHTHKRLTHFLPLPFGSAERCTAKPPNHAVYHAVAASPLTSSTRPIPHITIFSTSVALGNKSTWRSSTRAARAWHAASRYE
ncbi:hypothetical protein K458DRAFT_205346 [Lentithecium fluviatile CBS 122367]|uniref:Uncharacterized protein n=1 Tax=Lentithecium fluviatile CBS 122367 TaxID=1168545 RepID=A0A6G1J9U2_9PLEO|nr:hypothetical protein K458DRAFT_205346 [Lentithecium fluviatile CBS 122367]